MSKIVIVEDDPIVARVYRTQLERAGYQVEVAVDGPSGLARIQEVRPQGILLDLMLPQVNGVEILKQLRRQPQFATTPIIVYTNAFVAAMIEEAERAGASKVCDKSEFTPRRIAELFKELGCPPAPPASPA